MSHSFPEILVVHDQSLSHTEQQEPMDVTLREKGKSDDSSCMAPDKMYAAQNNFFFFYHCINLLISMFILGNSNTGDLHYFVAGSYSIIVAYWTAGQQVK